MDNGNITILWQDDRAAVIDKPSGLLVHPSEISSDRDTLVGRLARQFERPPLPVHRLDRPVSGVLVGAFDSEAAAVLSRSFREGGVHKSYLAVVRGYMEGEGIIDLPLRDYDTGRIQESRTRYRLLARTEQPFPSRRFPTSRYSLMEVSPETGRFHQIRRHLARKGYPIVGDTSHGDTACNHQFLEYFGVPGLLLHARRVRFPHPVSAEEVTVQSPLPESFRRVFDAFGWSVP